MQNKEPLATEIDHLADVLASLKARAGDGLKPLDEARLLLALDQAARKLSKLGGPATAEGKRKRR
jgi:hypothetical protein